MKVAKLSVVLRQDEFDMRLFVLKIDQRVADEIRRHACALLATFHRKQADFRSNAIKSCGLQSHQPYQANGAVFAAVARIAG